MALEVDITKKLDGFFMHMQFRAEREIFAILGASGCGKSMTLKWLFMENDGFYPTETWRQVERLDKMKLMHKSFLVKSGNGKRFIGDIHSPQETTYEAIRQIEDIQIEVYEVGEIND